MNGSNDRNTERPGKTSSISIQNGIQVIIGPENIIGAAKPNL